MTTTWAVVPEEAAAAAPPPLPPPLTCWPVVRLTDATVPAMVEVSEASVRFVCAVVSEDSAEVTAASSESMVVVDEPEAWSLERRSSAAASCAWAAARSACSAVGSTVARTCPAVTVCPALTLTPVTVPDTAKVERSLGGRLDCSRRGHRLLDRSGGHRHRLVGEDDAGGGGASGQPQAEPGSGAGQNDDGSDEDGHPTPPPGRWGRLGRPVLAEQKFLGQVDRFWACIWHVELERGTVSRGRATSRLVGHIRSTAPGFHSQPCPGCEPAWCFEGPNPFPQVIGIGADRWRTGSQERRHSPGPDESQAPVSTLLLSAASRRGSTVVTPSDDPSDLCGGVATPPANSAVNGT